MLDRAEHMQITIRITKRRLIVVGILAVLLASICLLRLALPGPNAAIGDRNSIRARLAIPKDLRQFPVEQYTAQRDWYVYRHVAYPSRACHWQLYIVCADDDAEKWCRAFRDYLNTRGRCIERGGNAMLAGQELRFYLSQDSGGSAFIWLRNVSGRLQITFEYRKARRRSRIWQTKFGRYLAAVLLKIGLPIDAITRPT